MAVAGRPGTGKTTLFREFIKVNSWVNVEPKRSLPALYSQEKDLYILGKYQEGELFAGTDRLSMSIQPTAEEFIKETSSNVLFEGDRLTNGKFYDFLMNLPDAEISFTVLNVPTSTLNQRYKERGSEQSDSFLRGPETKINNIMSNFDYRNYISEFPNENLNDQQKILAHMNNFFS